MLNIDLTELINKFKLGDIDRIFVAFYSYFIVGFLILFVIFENNFLNLELSTQIFLAIAISFPIITIPSAVGINKRFKGQTSGKGFFYNGTVEFLHASYCYSILFSLFYIVKHLIINYDNKYDTIIGILIIFIYYIIIEIKNKQS